MKKDKRVEEGVVAGDHGGDPIAIASGDSSGNAVNAGASTGKGKKTKLKRSKIKSVVLEFKANQE